MGIWGTACTVSPCLNLRCFLLANVIFISSNHKLKTVDRLGQAPCRIIGRILLVLGHYHSAIGYGDQKCFLFLKLLLLFQIYIFPFPIALHPFASYAQIMFYKPPKDV